MISSTWLVLFCYFCWVFFSPTSMLLVRMFCYHSFGLVLFLKTLLLVTNTWMKNQSTRYFFLGGGGGAGGVQVCHWRPTAPVTDVCCALALLQRGMANGINWLPFWCDSIAIVSSPPPPSPRTPCVAHESTVRLSFFFFCVERENRGRDTVKHRPLPPAFVWWSYFHCVRVMSSLIPGIFWPVQVYDRW